MVKTSQMGRTTGTLVSERPRHYRPDHPGESGPGKNFLIAKAGDQNLIVDDFELRFSNRIVADNAVSFANSGVRYRSKDLGNFDVGGYQGDFEAGSTYSGILYDEAGGAGGRGIMAQRGELVSSPRSV